MMSKAKQSIFAKHDLLDGDAHIFKVPQSGDVWQFRMWIKEDKKHYRKSLKTKDFNQAMGKAKELAMELMTNLRTGRKIYSITLQELVDLYLLHRAKDIDKTTGITKERITAIKSQLSYFLQIKGADTKVSTLDRKCMTDYQYLRKTSRNAEYSTSKNEGMTINAMWKWGYDEGYTHFKKFEFKKIVIKNSDIGRRDTFTDKEYDNLCRFMRNWTSVKQCKGDRKTRFERLMVRDYILISANLGLRVGEARQLKWGDVERIEEHIIDEETEETQLLVKLKVRWETSKVRTAREFLSRGGEYFVRLKERQQFTDDDDLVFSMDGKKSLTSAKWTRHWKSLMNGVGIDYKKIFLKDENGDCVLDEDGNTMTTGRNITYYSLRHYQISSRVKSGVPLIDISKQVGTSVGHIEKTYLHYEEEQSRTNALKTYTKVDGIITPTNNIKKKKERNSNEYGSQELRLSSRYLH